MSVLKDIRVLLPATVLGLAAGIYLAETSSPDEVNDIYSEPELITIPENEISLISPAVVSLSVLAGAPQQYREPDENYRVGPNNSPDLPVKKFKSVSVPFNQERFNAVIRLIEPKQGCSGTVIEMDGYDTVVPGVLISTSAHCAFRAKTYEDINPADITFKGVYQTAFDEEVIFELRDPIGWVHPDYDPEAETINGQGNKDLALYFFPAVSIPEGVRPYKQVVFDVPANERLDLYEYQSYTAAGYTAGIHGLSASNCEMIDSYNQSIATSCTQNKGSSGGPLSPQYAPYVSVGVLYGVSEDNDQNFFNYFTPEILETVDFLTPSIAEETQEACATVTAQEGLNFRSGPSTQYEADRIAFAYNSIVQIPDLNVDNYILDEIGREWVKAVRPEDGKTGYVTEENLAIIGPCF